jgi:hypothetical protein
MRGGGWADTTQDEIALTGASVTSDAPVLERAGGVFAGFGVSWGTPKPEIMDEYKEEKAPWVMGMRR